MHTHELTEASRIHDHHTDLFRTERTCLADLPVSVADFEHRGLHRALGYATNFQYLHRALAMSKAMAHHRMVGARLVRRSPEVEEAVRDGRLCLTTVFEVARVMTEENRAEVLPRFFGLSRQEAREVAAEIDPARVVPRRTVVSPVVTETAPDVAAELPAAGPGRSEIRDPLPAPGTEAQAEAGSTVEPGVGSPGRSVEAERTTVAPLTGSISRLHMTASREFLSLLRKARSGESHRSPGATDEQVVKRDDGRCQWPLPDGSVCGATARLEIDHVVPRGKGGASTVENCRVLCKGHDLEAARQAYGDAVVDHFTRSAAVGRLPIAGEEAAPYGPAPAASHGPRTADGGGSPGRTAPRPVSIPGGCAGSSARSPTPTAPPASPSAAPRTRCARSPTSIRTAGASPGTGRVAPACAGA